MTFEDVYSPFKVARHEEKLEQLRKGELITPVFVQWDLSNRCPYSCAFCFYHIYPLSDWDSNDIMPTEIVLRVMRELKDFGVKAVEWTGGGSIETHPNYKEIFKEAKKLGFEQSLVTSGALLDDEAIGLIKDFEWVRFSVDAATRETYKKVRGLDLFDRTKENLIKLLRIRGLENVIGFSFVVCRENYKEILAATKLAKSLGCDNIRFSLAMTPQREHLFDGIWRECLEQMELAKKEETKKFRVFTFSNRINELALNVLSEHCYYCQFVSVLAPRGIYPCCRLKDNKAYNFGDLRKHSFKEIWFGEKRRKFVERVAKEGCPFECWMTSKNAVISYLLQDNPRHVNFI